MKTLYLLRHAKSSWSDATLSDRLRPLNKRGRNAASQVGRFVHSRGLVPDLVLCSPATRTRETLQRMADEWDAAPPVRYEEGLYEFSAGSSYLSLVRAAPADVGSLMLIGHNPTMEMLAAHLIGTGAPKALGQLDTKYPTGALAELTFEISSWQEVREGSGYLRAFTIPRELSE